MRFIELYLFIFKDLYILTKLKKILLSCKTSTKIFGNDGNSIFQNIFYVTECCCVLHERFKTGNQKCFELWIYARNDLRTKNIANSPF